MKKKITLALAVIMVLGSVKAMAMTAEEAHHMNQLSKIETMAEAREGACTTCSDSELTRIAATQLMQIEQLKNEVDELISAAGDQGSSLQENSLGQISFLADTYDSEAKATDNANKINQIWEQAMSLQKEVTKIKARLNIK